ncbi:MAG TPA: tetratricopeptide repeat protein [Candidatus Polarisedimenticolia bacterium]|nr:tetratricopeptide repeat protein [Candidatus Polarisedimenticolia bacterium]
MKRNFGTAGRVLALLPAVLLAGGAPLLADSAAGRNNDGNRLYENERYDEALKMYVEAQALDPEAPELHYNIGNVLFRKGEYDKAAEEYVRAQAAEDPHLAQAATYNRGNALLQQGQLKEAVNSYIQALRAQPSDADAKRNLELALRLLQEQQQQQQQQQQQGKEGEDDEQRDGEQPPPPADQQQEQQDEQPPPQRRPGEMSEEEARQILDALREDEKEGIRKHARASASEDRQPEKDW